MSDVAQLALLRGCIWLPAMYYGIRHRSLLTISAVCMSWMANLLTTQGYTLEAGIIAVPYVGLLCFLLIDRLAKNPAHVKHVLAVQVKQARVFAHDSINEANAEFARQMTAEIKRRRRAESLLDEHGIEH